MRRFFILLTMGLFGVLSAEENRVVVITGASRGVGLATAQVLAQKGFTVYGTIRESGVVPATVEKNLFFLPVDLTDEGSIQGAIQKVLDEQGHIDVLVNNAGYAIAGPVETLTDKEIKELMEVNFYAPVRFSKAVLPAMRSQLSGRIIYISSVNAIITPAFGSMYGASKAALESFAESLCVEIHPYHVFISIVEPGFLATHFSIPLGTREIPGNPYQKEIDLIESALQERALHPELLPDAQTPEEIAFFLFDILQDPHPQLRYQTSLEAKEMVSKKLLDLTGEIYLRENGLDF